MATIRTNDFVFIFNGGNPFSQISRVEDDVDLKEYTANRDKLNHGRSLVAESRGADEDIDGNVKLVLNTIRSSAKGRMDTVGQVCLLGRSNGCSLALGVAAELNDLGITDLTYVGVSDVTMFAAGRKPPIAKVGNLQPTSDPTTTAAKSPGRADRIGLGGQHPVPENETPLVKLTQEIKAKNKVNLYQIQGNHMKYAKSISRWIWWSDLSLGEVHGKVEGFDNRLRQVQGRSDLDLHVNLNTQEHWKAMCREAATALATFPPEALAP